MNLSITSASTVDTQTEIPQQYARDLRRADLFIQLAVVAVHHLFENRSSQEAKNVDCGLFLGSSFGPMETNFDVLDQVVQRQQTSPTLFSHSVFNAAAGYVARIFDIRGPAVTITDFNLPFFQAIQLGINALESNRIKNCILLQVETYSELFNDARKETEGSHLTWVAGASALFLEKTKTGKIVKKFNLVNNASPVSNTLDFRVGYHDNGQITELRNPLEATQKLAEALMAPANHNENHFKIEAATGSAELIIIHRP